MKSKNYDFLIYLVAVLIVGVFLGYFWRMFQGINHEKEAFEAGQEIAIRYFVDSLRQQQNGHTFHLNGLKITPRDDGRFTVEINESNNVELYSQK